MASCTICIYSFRLLADRTTSTSITTSTSMCPKERDITASSSRNHLGNLQTVGERTPGAGSDWTSYNEGDREHGHAYSMVGKREEYESSRT